jgi:hypothetical protein
MALECFAPFIVYGLKKFVNDKIAGSNYIYKYVKAPGGGGSFQRIELASHWSEMLLSENIKKVIKIYTDSKERRLDPFLIETASGEMVPLGYITENLEMVVGSTNGITGKNRGAGTGAVPDSAEAGGVMGAEVGNSVENLRPLTLCEIFYIVACNTIRDKPVLITRYPVEDYHNIYPSLMNIIPFSRTGKAAIEGVEYPRFPLISEADIADREGIAAKFIDTFKVFPSYLGGFLQADFDGDTISIQGVFTRNSESKEYIYSKLNVINIGGGTMHLVGDITAHTMYALTRKLEKIA